MLVTLSLIDFRKSAEKEAASYGVNLPLSIYILEFIFEAILLALIALACTQYRDLKNFNTKNILDKDGGYKGNSFEKIDLRYKGLAKVNYYRAVAASNFYFKIIFTVGVTFSLVSVFLGNEHGEMLNSLFIKTSNSKEIVYFTALFDYFVKFSFISIIFSFRQGALQHQTVDDLESMQKCKWF